MINSKEGIVTGPLKLTLIGVIGMYAIISFINPAIILHLLAIIVIIFIFGFALNTIFLNLLPVFLSFTKRLTNILPSFIFVLLASATIVSNIPRPMFSTDVVNLLLIFTLVVIGSISIGFGLINTSFPKWHRQLNILIGSISIILSLITMMNPTLGFEFLTIIVVAIVALDKAILLLKGSGEDWLKWGKLFMS